MSEPAAPPREHKRKHPKSLRALYSQYRNAECAVFYLEEAVRALEAPDDLEHDWLEICKDEAHANDPVVVEYLDSTVIEDFAVCRRHVKAALERMKNLPRDIRAQAETALCLYDGGGGEKKKQREG